MKFLSPSKARARTLPKIRSFSDVLLWIRNPILLENIKRKKEKKYPYWQRWNSLSLHFLKGRSKNSYAMFVEGQTTPRLVLKKIITTYTSYGVKLLDIWGIIYSNEPENLFMYADYGIQNFGKKFSEDVSAKRPSSIYNTNKKMKEKIIYHAIDDLRRGGKILWDQITAKKYLNILHKMAEDIEKGEM